MNDHSAQETYHFNEDGMIVENEQYIGPDFWHDLRDAQEAFQFRLNGLTHAAQIPEALVNRWIREGFDFWSAPTSEILKKLRSEHYERFIVSGDKTF